MNITYCKTCGEPIYSLPFNCKRCNENYCAEHLLPELHNCPNMPVWWHDRGKNVIITKQFGESESTYYICQISNEEEIKIPTTLTL